MGRLNWIELNFIIKVHICRYESQAYNISSKIIEHLGSEALTGNLVQKFIYKTVWTQEQ